MKKNCIEKNYTISENAIVITFTGRLLKEKGIAKSLECNG